MHCELCGREIRKGFLVRIEGATLIACPDCAERGEIIRPVREEEEREIHVFEPAEEEKDLLPVENYGKLVRRAREERGLTIEELAHRLSIKENTLRKIEEEKLVPPLDVARKLERFLNIRIYEEVVVEAPKPATDEKPVVTLGDVVKLRWKR